MTENLKRCPFCGSEAEYTSIDQEFVRCSKGLQCPTEAAVFAVEDWQSRPLEEELRKAQAKMYALLKMISDPTTFMGAQTNETLRTVIENILTKARGEDK